MPRRYPLSALYEARKLAKEKAESLVSELAETCARAEKYEAALRERHASARRGIIAEACAQREGAEHAAMAVLRLQQAEQHRRAAELQIEQLAEQVARAGDALAEQRAAFAMAQNAAVRARKELAVVERHRSRYVEQVEKSEENRAEEEAAETWVARRQTSKSGSQ